MKDLKKAMKVKVPKDKSVDEAAKVVKEIKTAVLKGEAKKAEKELMSSPKGKKSG